MKQPFTKPLPVGAKILALLLALLLLSGCGAPSEELQSTTPPASLTTAPATEETLADETAEVVEDAETPAEETESPAVEEAAADQE